MKRVVGRTLIILGGTLIAAFFAGVFSAGTACAHDPRFACSPRPASSPVAIGDVAKSWAFYGRLASPQRDYYDFSTAVPLRIPVDLLVDKRDAANPARPSLIVEGANQREIMRLDLSNPGTFDEPFSRVSYLSKSGELDLAPGRYTAVVSMSGRSPQRYTFAIGRDERFGILEIPYVLGAVYRIHNRDF